MKTTISLLLILFSATFVAAQNDAKNMTPPEGKSLIYFVRPSSLGKLLTFITTCDDKVAGKTKGNRFIFTEVDPGNHKLVTSGGEKDASLELTTEANKIYFIEIIPKMGMVMARVKMEQVEEADGRKKLDKCKPGLAD